MEFKVFEQLWFPTPVWECNVTGINNNSIKEYCLEVRQKKKGVTISNRGGWHSNELIHPLPDDLTKLFKDMEIFVNDVCYRHMGIPLKLGNFWININKQGDYNMPHDHQKSILSGVYYVDVPSNEMGDLVLHRGDTAEYFLTSDIEKSQTMTNVFSAIKPAKTSTFYIFPSWVKHHVERNETKQQRISIAFNFVPLNA